MEPFSSDRTVTAFGSLVVSCRQFSIQSILGCDQHGPVPNPVIHQLPYLKISVVGMRAVRLNALYLFGQCTLLVYFNIFLGCEHHWPFPPFDNLYAILQAFRIGCHDLTIENLEWTKEQCEAMFNTLKPVKVKLNSAGSNRFEALFQLNSLVTSQTCFIHRLS